MNLSQGSLPSWSSTPGSTRITSSTRTRRRSSSRPCGTSGTGTDVSDTPAHGRAPRGPGGPGARREVGSSRRRRDMGLREYYRQARLREDARAAGQGAPGRRAVSFCVQKHAATRLHYDFRLELDGVLKSWAVPKGPSLRPRGQAPGHADRGPPARIRRLRGRHPRRANTAAAPCCSGTAGAGSRSRTRTRACQAGRAEVPAHGEKLQGGWTLVKTRGRDAARRREELAADQGDGRARAARRANTTSRSRARRA